MHRKPLVPHHAIPHIPYTVYSCSHKFRSEYTQISTQTQNLTHNLTHFWVSVIRKCVKVTPIWVKLAHNPSQQFIFFYGMGQVPGSPWPRHLSGTLGLKLAQNHVQKIILFGQILAAWLRKEQRNPLTRRGSIMTRVSSQRSWNKPIGELCS